MSLWYPVASGSDLVPRHVFHTALDGQELALWRDDAGLANVWENRCPHRGVRLSMGANLGTELRCQYHGWRFSSGSGHCASIPAHPGFTPSQGLRVRTYACVERYGLVWTSLGDEAEDIPDLGAAHWRPLRAIFVEAPPASVEPHLPEQDGLRLFLQPVSDTRSVIHGLSADPTRSLRRYDEALTRLRDRIEGGAP
jgi:phenylpropionate dioxygenase-like ring-hydroxylating dioxygenase large terminal subunit